MTEPIKPEVLRLAEWLSTDYSDDVRVTAAAAELRRLHAEVERLRDGLLAWQTASMDIGQQLKKAEAEVERLCHNNRVLTDAVWKACGDEESAVHDTIASQGDLK
jgi:hypothetical protein